MSHKVTITRNELTAILNQSFAADEIIDLNELASTFAESESKVRTAEFFENFLVSTYVLHAEHIEEVITVPLDVEDANDLAVPLIKALSEGKILDYIDHTQIVLDTAVPEIIGEMLINGKLTDPSQFDADTIRLAIHVTSIQDSDLPPHFDNYNCTKLRILI